MNYLSLLSYHDGKITNGAEIFTGDSVLYGRTLSIQIFCHKQLVSILSILNSASGEKAQLMITKNRDSRLLSP